MIKPLNNHYAFETHASIYDEEAVTALELSGRVLGKVNEIAEVVNQQNERIDTAIEDTIPAITEAEVTARVKDGTFDQAIALHTAELTARLDNIAGATKEGSTSMDVEIIDGRVDNDGYAHANLYNRMAWTEHALEKRLEYANVGYDRLMPHWENGSFNANTLENVVNTKWLRTAEIIPVTKPSVEMRVGAGYAVKLFEYRYEDGVYTWLADTGWKEGDRIFAFNPQATHFRGAIKRVDETAITPVEHNSILLLNRTPLYEEIDTTLKMLPGVYARTSISATAVNNEEFGLGWTLSNTRRWFCGEVIPAKSYIRKIGLHASIARDSVVVSVWEKDGDTITKIKEVNTPVIVGVNYIDLETYSDKALMVGVYTPVACIDWDNDASASDTMYGASNLTADTLSISAMETKVTKGKMAITIYFDKPRPSGVPCVYEVGDGLPFSEIQEAIDASTGDEHAIIMVYPRATPYKKFSTIRDIGAPYPWEGLKVRNLDIIGLSKVSCVVQDDSGEYDSPASEIAVNGVIRGLTFKTTNDRPLATPVKGGYACHIDGRIEGNVGYNMTFEDCVFISYTGPAVGVGLQADTTLKFERCEMISYADPDYKPNANYSNLANFGALYCHTATIPAPNQKLYLDGCRIISAFGNRAVWLSATGDYTPFVLLATHNTIEAIWPNSKRVVMDSALILDAMSHGNNSTKLNGEIRE